MCYRIRIYVNDDEEEEEIDDYEKSNEEKYEKKTTKISNKKLQFDCSTDGDAV